MHLLVIANETVEGDELHDAVVSVARSADADVLVVAPALNTRLRHWMSDEDGARGAARERVERCVERLHGAGVAAHGKVGDADPLQAIADALATFPADELVISTHPERRSNWLAGDLVERAFVRFGLPTAHVVVDLSRDSMPVAA